MKQKKFKFSGDLLTFILVAAVYAVVAYLLYGGSLTRQFSNMIIPISVYIVLAVSLNLVVGLLGELSLGHAGFMSVGLFSGFCPSPWWMSSPWRSACLFPWPLAAW